MAQRFGGKYSPDGSAGGTAANSVGGQGPAPLLRSKDEGRTKLLFILPLLFPLRAFTGAPETLVLALATCAVLLLAAWLTREGVRAEMAYAARKVAQRPALPRKILGSALTGVGLALGASAWTEGLVIAVLLGVAGAVLHSAAFGFDPMKAKGMEGIDSFQTERVARAVAEAEALLAGMKDAILRAKDRALETRVERFAATAQNLFRTIESDPRDLTAARKYLSVYLMGARDATVKFADHYAQSRDAATRTDYEALLSDLETTFAERTKAMLTSDHSDLDVEIQVLRERLKLEN